MNNAKDLYNELFAWYKPEENPEAPVWMKVVYNYIMEIKAENEKLKSYNQLEIDLSLKVVQLEEDKAELIKFIEKVEYMIPMSLYPTIKNGATEILRKF